MKTKKKITITKMNVWDFKKSYTLAFETNRKYILHQINTYGFCMVEAGKTDYLKLTY